MAVTDPSPHKESIAFCESCLEKHGDTGPGVGWLRDDAEVRYQIMLEVIRPTPERVELLDFGCGTARLLDYLRAHDYSNIAYRGLDLSKKFLAVSRRKYPNEVFYQLDVLDSSSPKFPEVDYIVLNGIFTYKGSQTHEAMFQYLARLVTLLFSQARIGIAFNVITKQVDWEREDLFHVPVDDLLTFLSHNVSRHVVIRHDYALYEYTAYVYREPAILTGSGAKRLVGR